MAEAPDLELIANRMHSAAIHLLRHVAAVDAESGLSPARLSALSVIVYGGPLTMTRLAASEQVSPATITSSVTGLEVDGLVVRRRESPDARRVTVEATARGRAVMDASRARRVAVLQRALSTLDSTDQSAIATAANAIEHMLAHPPP